jgi:thiamine biosynthesis lipoprotein
MGAASALAMDALPVRLTVQREVGFWRCAFAAMASPCEILIETEDQATAHAIADAVSSIAWRIERKFSRYRDDSVVAAIHRSGGSSIRVDDETARLLDYGATLWRISEGAFDLTSGVLRHAWRFQNGAPPPTREQIDALMQRVGWSRVKWSSPELTLPAGMEIDFGGIGKEYAVDLATDAVQSWPCIPVLVNFGGDLRVAGPTPRAGVWHVGVESAVDLGSATRRIELAAGALATSGDTRRFVEVNGQRFGHIVDARTGWPVPNAPRSVTVAAPTCTQAGTFSTLAMMQGANAEIFLREQGVKYWCER